MDEKNIIRSFLKTLFTTTAGIVFLILDIAAVIPVFIFVADTPLEYVVIIIYTLVVNTGFYFVYKGLYIKLAQYEQTQPNIIFDQVRQTPLYRSTPVSDTPTTPYECVQAWFINAPEMQTESSRAKDVTAKIEFWCKDSKIVEAHGQWAITRAPDHAGHLDTKDMIDIPPGNIPQKLLIAVKYKDESDCYAYAKENIMGGYLDLRHPQYKIPEGNYQVRINLSGIGVNKDIVFQLRNPGVGQSLEFTYINNQ